MAPKPWTSHVARAYRALPKGRVRVCDKGAQPEKAKAAGDAMHCDNGGDQGHMGVQRNQCGSVGCTIHHHHHLEEENNELSLSMLIPPSRGLKITSPIIHSGKWLEIIVMTGW